MNPTSAAAAPLSITTPRRGRWSLLAWIAVSLLIGFNFAMNLQQNGKAFLNAEAYSHLQEKRPYQYRLLMAPVMGGIMDVLKRPAVEAQLKKFPVYLATPDGAAYVLVNGFGLALSCLLMAALARKVLGAGEVRRVMVIYLGLCYLFLCVNPNVPFILPYDIPSLVLTQACLLALLERRWALLYACFALATLNRETCFLVIMFLALRTWREPAPRRAIVHVVLLSALWFAIKAALFLHFKGLPSDEGTRLVYNLRSIAKPWWWPALLPLIGSVVLAARSLRTEREQPEWAAIACVGFALIFVVGQVLETRAFTDLITFLALAIGLWLVRVDARTRAQRVSGPLNP